MIPRQIFRLYGIIPTSACLTYPEFNKSRCDRGIPSIPPTVPEPTMSSLGQTSDKGYHFYNSVNVAQVSVSCNVSGDGLDLMIGVVPPQTPIIILYTLYIYRQYSDL